MDQIATSSTIPVLGRRLPARRLPRRRRPADLARSIVALARPVALGALCGDHERAVRRREHRHRGDDAERARSSAFVAAGLVSAGHARRSPSADLRRHAGAAHRRASRRSLTGDARVDCSTPGCRSRSGPTRSSAARSSTSPPSALTGYLNRLIISPNPRLGAGIFAAVRRRPTFLTDLPVVGWLFKAFLDQGPIAMSVIVPRRSSSRSCCSGRAGACARGPSASIPKAADTVGIDVIRLRYRNVILGGVFAGLAGAFLTLESDGSFQHDMTDGRGFIALAAVIFGRWTPIGAFGAALLFAVADALQVAIGPDAAGRPARRRSSRAIPSRVLRRAALHRHDHRPGRRRRPERRRRPRTASRTSREART